MSELGKPYPGAYESIILESGEIPPRVEFAANWIPTEGQPLPQYVPPPQIREELTLNLMTFQYVALVLMRRMGIDATSISIQEVELVKRLGIKADIGDDGSIAVKLNEGMGS